MIPCREQECVLVADAAPAPLGFTSASLSQSCPSSGLVVSLGNRDTQVNPCR